MAELPYMPVHVADAIADAEGLTNEELGALVRIRWALWRAGGLLAETRIGRYARAGKRWGTVSAAVLERLQFAGGKVSCPVVTSMLVLTRARRVKAARAGRASAAARVSEGSLNATSGGILNGRKPLKFQHGPSVQVGPKLNMDPNNHNQNKGENPENIQPTRTELSTAEAQNAALFRDGLAVVMERARCTRAVAMRDVNQWLGRLDGDADGVAGLIARADTENFKGHTFSVMVGQWAKQAETERTLGYSLPLPPVLASRKAG